ncbi:PHP domain-containing protein [Imhoffiella purpurea]|uniref:Putative metal-dependent phosphoesterases (PHP family) n=1 Tax=Imhoffiella purpurea TaxID=1249627 RepID=W9VJH3_9GAMM|nr:PHP domain-containing protein [Imhoffiella purpurea]EXJ16212.1 Putative metal-dependent phosphoesterases (PHP family) [Imhoffiella purpurea]
MTRIPDLHTHSTASDGTLTPAELVARAASAGVTLMALTDHDNTDGVEEARRAAVDAGIHLIPGVEISVTWGARTVHVVGLNLDTDNADLQQGLARLLEFRAWRAEEMGRRLAKHGIENAYEGARAFSNGTLIGRTHFARFLVSRRLAADTAEVFRHFLTSGKPGHVAGRWASLEEAVGWIRGAGGQAVVAHPARYGLTRTRMQRLLGEFRELGGAGVEVVTGSHSRDDAFNFARHAREQRLLASAGSDYHGPIYPWLELGRLSPLPEGCTPIWHDWPEMADAEPAPRIALG